MRLSVCCYSQTESEAFYMERMGEQKQELQMLMDEKNKLLTVQAELKALHDKYVGISQSVRCLTLLVSVL